ncbi:MAG TPA: hypothetical protein DCF66_00665, partial [Lachnospiraceae bacterium]|nr:hypothetical protein [Lachnospiraceae bacterium]
MNLNMDAMDIIDYIDKSTYVILLRVYTESDTIQIPEQIDGKPVRELADHAFADEPSVLYAESEKRRAVRSGDCWTFQSAGAGASAASTHFSGERTERPDASVNAAVQNSERRNTLPPALCGRRLRAVVLPDALAAIGNYAFYGCDNLKTVSFPASIRRIGSGLFNSCPALSVLVFRQAVSAAPPATPALLQEVLRTVNHEVEVRLQDPSGQDAVRLLFPEYYEEPKENTPARIIEIIWHGTGYQYRQCFLQRKLQYSQYDSLLPAADAQEMPQTLVRLCLDRLITPAELSRVHLESYVSCLRKRPDALWTFLLADQETDLTDWLRVLERSGYFTEERLDQMIDQASSAGRADASVYLMDLRRRMFRPSSGSKY